MNFKVVIIRPLFLSKSSHSPSFYGITGLVYGHYFFNSWHMLILNLGALEQGRALVEVRPGTVLAERIEEEPTL